MKTTQRLALILIFSFITIIARSQDRVYLTYEDFMSNKYIAADEKTFKHPPMHVALKSGGEVKKWKTKEIWGFVEDQKLYRVLTAAGGSSAEVVISGKFVLYNISGTSTDKDGRSHYYSFYYLSENLHSPAFGFKNRPTLTKLIAKHPEFAPINEYWETHYKGVACEEVVIGYINANGTVKTGAQLLAGER